MNRPEVYTKRNLHVRCNNALTLDTYLKLIQWKKCPKILDIGSGDGKTTKEILEPRLPQDYIKLVGADLQEEMVKFAKESNNNMKLDFVKFDIAGKNLLPEKYDHIFSFYTFHWLDNLSDGFSNIYELLTPGGDFLISMVLETPVFHLMKQRSLHNVWGPYFKNLRIPKSYDCENPEKVFEKLLKESKFSNIKVYVEHLTFTYKNWTDCSEFYLTLDPIMVKLDDKQKTEYSIEFHHDLQKIYGVECEELDGKITVPYKNLIMYASKLPDEKM